MAPASLRGARAGGHAGAGRCQISGDARSVGMPAQAARSSAEGGWPTRWKSTGPRNTSLGRNPGHGSVSEGNGASDGSRTRCPVVWVVPGGSVVARAPGGAGGARRRGRRVYRCPVGVVTVSSSGVERWVQPGCSLVWLQRTQSPEPLA
ncbi:hypothetical protein ACFFX0_00525 [Citricoccus parietis]|uniref:Uncharacterized protein n=1 Tax=Citricoccus parietis TaxID=592307 RepID=A0ABV5FSV1_9MICC